jgi:hypothetical protein
MPSDARRVARIALEHKLIDEAQLADCMTDPEADTGLPEVMAERGYITIEQLEWLWRAEARYRAEEKKREE